MTTDPNVMNAVREPVRQLLSQSPSFRALDRSQQKEIYRNMLSLGAELAEQASRGELPESFADVDTHGKMIETTGMAGARVAGATLRQVQFPEFVSSLIKGVFQSIVDASIQQMQAYGDLLQTVTGTVEEFASKLSDNDAAMYAAIKEPKTYTYIAKGKSGKPTLKTRNRELNEKQLAEVLTSYKLAMAEERRGLLREMVFMGINRVVVTDGLIHAKLVFHLDTTSDVTTSDSSTTNMGVNGSIAQMPVLSWFGMGGGVSRTSVSTVDVNSSSNMNIDITGEVKVNFKSDYFPLESFAGLYQKLKEAEPERAALAEAQRGAANGQPANNTNAPAPTTATP